MHFFEIEAFKLQKSMEQELIGSNCDIEPTDKMCRVTLLDATAPDSILEAKLEEVLLQLWEGVDMS